MSDAPTTTVSTVPQTLSDEEIARLIRDEPAMKVSLDELALEFSPAQAGAIRAYVERRLREQADAKLLATGFMTPNQARAYCGLEAPTDESLDKIAVAPDVFERVLR